MYLPHWIPKDTGLQTLYMILPYADKYLISYTYFYFKEYKTKLNKKNPRTFTPALSLVR